MLVCNLVILDCRCNEHILIVCLRHNLHPGLTSEVELEDALGQTLLYPGRLNVREGGGAVRVGRAPVVGLEYQVVTCTPQLDTGSGLMTTKT